MYPCTDNVNVFNSTLDTVQCWYIIHALRYFRVILSNLFLAQNKDLTKTTLTANL